MSGASSVSNLLKLRNIDILGWAEHWLSNTNVHFLDSISSKYTSFGVSDRDLCLPSNRKVGKGGVAIMLRSALSNNIPVLDIDSDRSCGIQYRLCNKLRDLSSCLDRDSVNFSCADIKNVLSQLKTKKACGRDGIHNEHLQIGGDAMIRELSILCTDMYNHGHIPDSLKQGVIITLHKGGRKSKKDPNNYHAISLTSSVLKVFERLILPMLENNLERPLNPMLDVMCRP